MANEPIAIVGVSCRLPGSANSLDSLWELLARGGEAWSPVPADRFNETAFYHPNANDPNGTNNHRGGHFIDGDIRDFDHAFFHLSPPVAAAMDPQQRILLELVYEALESAGWAREKCAGSRTAVYAAIFGMDYERNLSKDVLDLPVYQSHGTGTAILANRISHVFDLHGPSMTLDTGCSGGLVALHHAYQSLQTNESDAALVAAANLQLMPDHYISMSNQHMINSNGRCYPFDVRGDGYGRGEGFVVVALKRLSDALRDHDPIRSVVLNTGLNQDGYTASGITHPNHVAQADLIRETYAGIGLRPQDVAYVEAHGTGTLAGDKEELTAISEVFGGPDRSIPLYVGSNKGSIGHTESTSGLASLLKATLMLDRSIIPPVAGFATPKPGLPLDQIHIPTERLPWPCIERLTPYVSINSFGYGGANAHAILERGPRTYEICANSGPLTYNRLFILSANSLASLKSMLKSHANWVEQNFEIPLADISYTLCHRRSALPWRFNCVADTSSSLLNKLQQGLNTLTSKPVPSKRDVVFVFTGQGAQWTGMGRELLLESPSSIFRNSIRASGEILRELGATWDLETELLRQDDSNNLNKAELAQPATTAVQIALVMLLRAQNVQPSTVVGHSSGEIAAAYTAGRISQRTAIHIAFHRGFMAAASKKCGLPGGAMLSVGLGERDVAPYLESLSQGQAVVACINSPSSVTVSGDADAIIEIMARITARGDGTFHRRLLVDTAYHSHHMRAVANEYRARLGDLDSTEEHGGQQKKEVTLVSSVTGQPWLSDCNASYWTDNLVLPVRFSDAIQTLARAHHEKNGGHALFVEVGPHAALAGPVRQCLVASDIPKVEYEYLSTLQRGTSAVWSMMILAGRLFEYGVKMNFDEVSNLVPESDKTVVRPDLPAYTWDHSTKHWHESRLSREYRMRREPYHDLLGVRMTESTSIEPRWRHMVGLTTLPWLADHVIDSLIIFPGAGYVCMAAEAIVQLAREQYPEQVLEALAFRDISFLRALVVPDAPKRVELQLSLKHQPNTSPLNFAFSVAALSDGKWHEPCTGFVEGVMANNKAGTEAEAFSPLAQELWPDGNSLIPEELYAEMARDGNTYGPAFRGLRSFNLTADASRSAAVVEVPDIEAVMPAQHQVPHIMHPALFDSMFHVGIPMIKQRHGAGAVMPVHIGELLFSTKTRLLSSPGSKLDVSATLTSSHFRSTHIDMTVTANGYPVLSASEIESRSLAGHTHKTDSDGICYELTWRADFDFLRAVDLSKNPSLTELVDYICFKSANISVLELAAGHGDLASVFLTAVTAHGGTITTYDFVDDTSEHFDKVRKRLIGYPVSYRILDPNNDIDSQGFTPHAYEVVLASDVGSLAHVSGLIQTNGVLVLVLKSNISDDWRAALLDSCPGFDIQLTFPDIADGSLVIIARNGNALSSHLPSHVRILTHSTPENAPSWSTTLTNELLEMLNGMGIRVSQDTLNQDSIQSDADTSLVIIVIDDLPQPILSDQHCFDAAIKLLRQKAQILWLSLNSPSSMHQITGVARTAHAENDDLRLITAHIAPDVLHNSRLVNLIAKWIEQVIDRGEASHHEREYRVHKDGIVLIPRLHSDGRLNRAIRSSEPANCTDIETCRFADVTRPLVLPLVEDLSSSDLDVHFVDGQRTDLAADAVEIETQAFVLSRSEDSIDFSLGEYAGIVKRVGEAVDNFDPGDAVVAISLDGVIGANRPHIPSSNVSKQPNKLLSPAISAGMLLPTLAAIHTIHELVHFSEERGVILVHGVLSDIGRAIVAVAHSIGIKIITTAANAQEAQIITQKLGIDVENIIIDRPSILRRPYDNSLQFDAIILAGEKPILAVAWACLKPFGQVVVFHTSSFLVSAPKLPRNAVIHLCHISDFLLAHPHHTAGLLTQAAAIFQHIPVDGLDIAIHDVAHIDEALRSLKLGVFNKVVLQVTPSSLIHAAAPIRANPWASEDASFVVAGGMGDLGRRFLLLMAGRGARHLITLSRRTVDPDNYRALQTQLELIRPGCRLHCLVCDVTSERSVQNAATTLLKSGVPPVRGVIQSAAFLQDHTLETMTFDNFLPVTLAKIEGTLALERVFTSPHLEFFLMLSSAVVVTGASGQANYNAGNAVQDAIAHARRPGFMSLNIGWIEDAIHTSNDKSKLQGLWRTGLRPIQHDELSRYFDYLLGAASNHSSLRQAVIGFDAESLSHTSARNSNVQSALFSHVIGLPKTNTKSSSSGSIQSFEEIVRSGDRKAVVDFITSAITNQLTTLIFVDATQVNERNGSILDLGLDSLVAIELRNWITREFDAPLQSSEIMTDQPIYDLAQKVASRSRIVLSGSSAEANGDSEDTTSKSSTGIITPSTSASSNTKYVTPKLSPLPLPQLEDTLRLFEESRRAVDTDNDRRATNDAVRTFLEGPGPVLYRQIQETRSDDIADAYERQVYLERREPLPESGPFTFIHPINAPAHSQTERAAILTVAAIDFARRLANGEVAPDMLHGKPLTVEGREWLFYATRRPGLGVDSMKRLAPNNTVAVLRRGHVFQITLPNEDQPLHLSAVHAAYNEILQASDKSCPSICTLTADERDSWALLRQDLECETENAAALACIDTAAFVMCLDDESPTNSGERYTQFILNGENRPFINRWLDKTLQFAVTANGLSAETYEHTKLDGLDARGLHSHILRALIPQSPSEKIDILSPSLSSSDSTTYSIHEYVWNPTSVMLQRIEYVSTLCRSYGPLDHQVLNTNNLGLASLRGHRSPPNATAHLTVLLALYLVDGDIRPVWEKVSLGTFERGRVEWVQTVSPPARAFIEAVTATTYKADTDGKARARALLNDATATYSRTMTAASLGHGAVGLLYALRGVAQQQQQSPALFNTRSWNTTRRGGPGQDIKIGFMRFEHDDDVDTEVDDNTHWDEAGFLVSGERSVYVHCNVREKHARFAISGKPAYVAKVCKALRHAADIVANLL